MYISLFSGAGIGCYGFFLERFDCIATVESSEQRLAIQRFNNKCSRESGYICGDLSNSCVQARIEDELARADLGLGELDVLIATPPCQGMSVCNHKKRNELPRNSLVVAAIKAVARWKPKVFLFENVRSFLAAECAESDSKRMPIGESIRENLSDSYEYHATSLNLKNYGCPSSRTRTLVIGIRKDLPFSPIDLMPEWNKARSLREVIGDLPRLTRMGEISPRDIYHSFRTYEPRMRKWIRALGEGESAFDNTDPDRIPHRIINGARIFNKQLNGDKYRRQFWDAPPPCVHTRNDILSSQNTIHPTDDRVFSVRELMLMISIPDGFKWSKHSLPSLQKLSLQDKRAYLRQNETNIRQCLGEAAPTETFRRIAANARMALSARRLSKAALNEIIGNNKLSDPARLKSFITGNPQALDLETLMEIAELANSRRKANAAYYTPPKLAYKLLQSIPQVRAKQIRVVEPAVGIGRILLQLTRYLTGYEHIEIDAIDIDRDALELAKIFASMISIPDNIVINFIRKDFLDILPDSKYDIVVGNPPFTRLHGDALRKHRANAVNKRNSSLFGFFLEKALSIGKRIALVAPKSFLGAPEYARTRSHMLANGNILAICDFGETGFEGVRIETLALSVKVGRSVRNEVSVESVPLNKRLIQNSDYIFDEKFPCWLIYRNAEFDRIAARLKLGVFGSFRDRQITSRHANGGGIRVIKSRNIGNGTHNFTRHDVFVRKPSEFAVSQYMGRNDIILVPNLSYSPRACRLPDNCVPDGSAAILYPLDDECNRFSNSDLQYFASSEFHSFYRLARNYGTRSLNIDSSSVYFFGIRENA